MMIEIRLVVFAMALILSGFLPVTVQADEIDDVGEDVEGVLANLPPGDYLIGPDTLNGSWGVAANDTTLFTQRSWERSTVSGQTLTVGLSWNEVGAPQITTTNHFHYNVTRNGEHVDFTDGTGTSNGIATKTYTEPGDYEITLTGLQGATAYEITITEQ